MTEQELKDHQKRIMDKVFADLRADLTAEIKAIDTVVEFFGEMSAEGDEDEIIKRMESVKQRLQFMMPKER